MHVWWKWERMRYSLALIVTAITVLRNERLELLGAARTVGVGDGLWFGAVLTVNPVENWGEDLRKKQAKSIICQREFNGES